MINRLQGRIPLPFAERRLVISVFAVWASLIAALPAATADDQPPSLRGVVVLRADGKPVAGATVSVFNPKKFQAFIYESSAIQLNDISRSWGPNGPEPIDQPRKPESGETTTDDNGRFTIPELEPGDGYQLIVSDAENGFAHRTDIRIPPATAIISQAGATSEPNAASAAKPDPSELKIEMGGPAYVEVEVDPTMLADGGRYRVSASTGQMGVRWVDGNGRTTFEEPQLSYKCSAALPADQRVRIGPIPPGRRINLELQLTGRRPGGPGVVVQKRTISLTSGETSQVSFAPGQGAALVGRITSPSGEPVAGARIACVRLDDSESNGAFNSMGSAGGLTNAEGRYRVAGIEPGRYRVQVFGSDSSGGMFQDLASLNVTIVDKSGEVVRDFTNVETGRPAIRTKAELPTFPIAVQVTSRANDSPVSGVQISAVPMQGGRVSVSSYEGELMLFDSSPELERLRRDDPYPMERHTLETDATGRATIDTLLEESGKYLVVVVHPEYGAAVLTDVTPAKYNSAPLMIALDRPAFVTPSPPSNAFGKDALVFQSVQWVPPGVVAADADALEKALKEVSTITFSGNPTPGSKRSAPVGPLAPGHTYAVSENLVTPKRTTTTTLLRQAIIKPAPGEKIDLSAPLDSGAIVSGRVTGESNAPLADVSVTIRTDEPSRLVLSTITDIAGRYRIMGVPPGNFPIRIERYGLRTAPG